MKKLLAFLLAAVMLCSMLAACNGDPATTDGPVDTNVADVTTSVGEDTPDIPAPGTVDIAGDFNFLVAGNYSRNNYTGNDFDYDGDLNEANSVDLAVYKRYEKLKEDYGVDTVVDFQVKFGSSNGGGTGFSKIYTDYMSGQSTYDAAMVGTYDVATLAYSGYIHDLNDMPNMDLTKSYWDQRANEDLTILGKMFYTSGDITVTNHMVTHGILFNKGMIEEYNLEDPYELVRNNEWTLESFGNIVKQVGEDVNQDGMYTESDRYGLLTWNDPMVAILSSSGEKIAGVNEDGLMELTFYNERVISLYDQFEAIVFDQQHAYNYQYDHYTGAATPTSVWNVNRDAIFTENRAVFYLNTLATVERHRDSDVDFGVLPYPKLDAAQENYGHQVSAYHAHFLCVPELAPDFERTGLVLEYLAYQGKQILTPAYYEQTLVGKSVRDEDSVEMLDIILASRVYDLGAYYDIGTYKTQLGRLFVSRQALSSLYETYRPTAEQKIAAINNAFSSME
ncbi:MAG: extracellular solute-binding protein [Clostridia bacterium]|nr:extracellular solute-binding protein [Clostridia bacterium]